jgi:hypothetical protein
MLLVRVNIRLSLVRVLGNLAKRTTARAKQFPSFSTCLIKKLPGTYVASARNYSAVAGARV